METDTHIGPDHEVHLYLKELGYSEQEIAGMTMNTRFFHDLGSYGDTAEEEIVLLQKRFDVDLTEFNFDRYFPPEFEGKNRFEAFVLNATTSRESRLIRSRERCEPLTLGMINHAILAKRWIS
jgi:hypothetical protein